MPNKIKNKNEMGGMFISPHKKVKLPRIVGNLWLPIGKSAGASGGGQSGNRYKKKHMRAGLPGTPNGEHVQKFGDACECGRCRNQRLGRLRKIS